MNTDAINEIRKAAEAVASVQSFQGEPRVVILRASALEPGTLLYLAPPANDEAVRLLREGSLLAQTTGGTAGRDEKLVEWIGKVEAFLANQQEEKG